MAITFTALSGVLEIHTQSWSDNLAKAQANLADFKNNAQRLLGQLGQAGQKVAADFTAIADAAAGGVSMAGKLAGDAQAIAARPPNTPIGNNPTGGFSNRVAAMGQQISGAVKGALSGLGVAAGVFQQHLKTISDPLELLDIEITKMAATIAQHQHNLRIVSGSALVSPASLEKARQEQLAIGALKEQLQRSQARRQAMVANRAHVAQYESQRQEKIRMSQDVYMDKLLGQRADALAGRVYVGKQHPTIQIDKIEVRDARHLLDELEKEVARRGYDASGSRQGRLRR